MKIYTKTGDKGETGIIGGRIGKDSPIIDAIGNLDELNASVGVVIAVSKVESRKSKIEKKNAELRMKNVGSAPESSVQRLESIQNIIFEIGAILANGKSNINLEKATSELELEIDKLEKELPSLTRFILPGGSVLSSYIHISRSICRRAERSIVTLRQAQDDKKNNDVMLRHSKHRHLVDDKILKFINRLSDYLFVLARFANKEQGKKEIYWTKIEN